MYGIEIYNSIKNFVLEWCWCDDFELFYYLYVKTDVILFKWYVDDLHKWAELCSGAVRATCMGSGEDFVTACLQDVHDAPG